MKVLIPAILLATSSTVLAHDDCDLNLNGGMTIEQNTITFSKKQKPLYVIENDESLIVNGEYLSLNSSQQALVTQYSTSIRATVPQAKAIALDAIDVAVDGVNLAFNQLLGEGNSVSSDLSFELNKVRDQIDTRFNAEQGFTIDENGFSGDEILGEGFEQRLEEVVEDAVQKSMGTVMVALGQELIFSGGDMEAFETRMEDFGMNIEQQIETRAEALEQKGEALCRSVEKIDDIEELLRAEIEQISHINMISVDKHHGDSI